MHPIAMCIPRQPPRAGRTHAGGVDGHAESLPAELGAEVRVVAGTFELFGCHVGQRSGRQSHDSTSEWIIPGRRLRFRAFRDCGSIVLINRFSTELECILLDWTHLGRGRFGGKEMGLFQF